MKLGNLRFVHLLMFVGAVCVTAGGGAYADDVTPGYDYWATIPGDLSGGGTYVDFGPTPLPIDFFGPGSDPFDGRVYLRGGPLDPPPALDLSTIIERKEVAVLPDPETSSDTIEIEMVALSLRSVEPIRVTWIGEPIPPDSFFDVYTTLTPYDPATNPNAGAMTIHHEDAGGGDYTDVWCNVYVTFEFVWVGGTLPTPNPLPPFPSPFPYLLEIAPTSPPPAHPGYPWQHDPTIPWEDGNYGPPGPNFFPVATMDDVNLYWWDTVNEEWVKVGQHPVTPFVSCCLQNYTCIVTTAADCAAQGGTVQGEPCFGAPQACCRGDGSCLMIDPTCCDEAGGTVVSGSCAPTAGYTEACCSTDDPPACAEVDPACCDTVYAGGSSQGSGTDCDDGDINGIADDCETSQEEMCPTPTGAADDPCSALQPTDCWIEPLSDEECWPVRVTPGTTSPDPVVLECSCLPPGGCGAVHIDQTTLSCPGDCPVPPHSAGDICQVFVNGAAIGQTSVDSTTLQPGAVVTCDCDQPQLEECPLGDDLCTQLQATDCLIDDVVDEHCLPKVFVIDAAGGVGVDECSCFGTTGCGAVHWNGTDLSCPGDCPDPPYNPGDICQIFINGLPSGQTSVNPGTLAGGDMITCDCDQPQEELCPLGDDLCSQLQATDCVLASVDDEQCWPRVFHMNDQGALILDECDCFGQTGCGAVQYDGSALSCPGDCPVPPHQVGDICQIFINGQPSGRTSVDASTLSVDDTVTCDCDQTGETEACCFDYPDVCQDLTPSACDSLGGTPQGPDTQCTAEDRACCLDNGDCIMVDPLCCDDNQGHLQPGGDTCTEEHACCLPNGVCVMLDPVCCEDLSGTPHVDENCTGQAACCFADGQCRMLDPLCCNDQSGTSYPGEVCTADEACCFSDGNCRDLDPVCCEDLSGDPQGSGSTCQTTNCEVSQACCLPSGVCVLTTHSGCVARGGDPQGPGTDCGTTVCSPLKWAQPPTYHPESQMPECFWGWDEISIYNNPDFPIMADDWLCTDGRAITDVHWWGSYLNYTGFGPPEQAPDAFHIGVWTDVARWDPSNQLPYSHPREMIWQWTVDRRDLNERPVGCDYYSYMGEPRGPDSCFKYDFDIPDAEVFVQDPGEHNVYWISISAHYYEPVSVQYPWGWKTRQPRWNDDAVRIFDPIDPAAQPQFIFGLPVEDPSGKSWDMAFVLTTEDTTTNKWEQPPNPAWSGYHAHDYEFQGGEYGFTTIADDWLCEGGVVTDLHWWGNFENDNQGSGIREFHLSIHDDIPADEPGGPGFSMPGALRWVGNVPMADITVVDSGLKNNVGEVIYFYEYILPEADWFEQIEGNIYWLDIRAHMVNPAEGVYWRWQESSRGWPWRIDSAVQNTDAVPWLPLGSDMAFRITSTPPFGPPIPPPPPLDWRKNRFVSFDPNNTAPVAFKVEMEDLACSATGNRCQTDADCHFCIGGTAHGQPCDGPLSCPGGGICPLSETCNLMGPPIMLGWVGTPFEPGEHTPAGMMAAYVEPTPVLRVWPEAVVHVGDCEIAPVHSYLLSATATPPGGPFAGPLGIQTIARPEGKFWGDCVGSFTGTAWTAPNGLVSVDDVVAFINFKTSKPAPHFTALELAGSSTHFVNALLSVDDLMMIIEGFKGKSYPPFKFTADTPPYPASMDLTLCP